MLCVEGGRSHICTHPLWPQAAREWSLDTIDHPLYEIPATSLVFFSLSCHSSPSLLWGYHSIFKSNCFSSSYYPVSHSILCQPFYFLFNCLLWSMASFLPFPYRTEACWFWSPQTLKVFLKSSPSSHDTTFFHMLKKCCNAFNLIQLKVSLLAWGSLRLAPLVQQSL